MNSRVAREIEWQRSARNVGNLELLAQRRAECEFLSVRREHQQPVWYQQRHGLRDQLCMVALHVEHTAHPRAVRKRWRVEKNQAVALRILRRPRQPFARVFAKQAMSGAFETIDAQVSIGPVQIRIGQVDRGRRSRTARRGVHRCGAGVPEQIQEVAVVSQAAKAQSGQSMIQEQARVEVVGEIDEEAQAILVDDMKLRFAIEFQVLLTASLTTTGAQMQVVCRHVEDVAERRECFAATATHVLFGNLARRGVLLDAGPALIALDAAIEIDGERVLGHVGVIDAQATDRLTFRPGFQMTQILPQSVAEHACARRIAQRLAQLQGIPGSQVPRCGRANFDAQ